MEAGVPRRPVDQDVWIAALNVVAGGVVVAIEGVFPSAEEALEALLVHLVVVVHIGPATRTPRDGSPGPFGILQLLVDGSDEAAHRRAVSIVEVERVGRVGVGKLDGGGVVLRVFSVLLVELLALRVEGDTLLGLDAGTGTWEGPVETWDMLSV